MKRLQAEFERWFADVTKREYARVPIEIGRADENPVEIDLTWGEPTGVVKPQYRDYNSDTIDNWVSTDDSVAWKVDVVASGEYELVLEYGCQPSDAGAIARLTLGKAVLDHTFIATPGRMVWATQRVGTMQLTKGVTELRMKPVKILGAELAAIHKIWIRKL
ncbi:MAG: hypothetical protein WKF37_11610 [Bryobacteraceae bacterium]